MLPIRTILHPTDFSKRSSFAFRFSCALARDYGARLLLLHVGPKPIVMYGEGVIPADPEKFRAQLREKLDELQPEDAKIPVERLFLEGDPVAEILKAAQENNCDLIVMGTHGWSGLNRLLMGSTAEGVMRKAVCPVLTVRTPVGEEVKPKEPISAEIEKAKEVVNV